MSTAINAFGLAYLVAIASTFGGESSEALRRRLVCAYVSTFLASVALVLSIVDTNFVPVVGYAASLIFAVLIVRELRELQALQRMFTEHKPGASA